MGVLYPSMDWGTDQIIAKYNVWRSLGVWTRKANCCLWFLPFLSLPAAMGKEFSSITILCPAISALAPMSHGLNSLEDKSKWTRHLNHKCVVFVSVIWKWPTQKLSSFFFFLRRDPRSSHIRLAHMPLTRTQPCGHTQQKKVWRIEPLFY